MFNDENIGEIIKFAKEMERKRKEEKKKEKEKRLEIDEDLSETIPSKISEYREANANIKERNKKLRHQNKALEKSQQIIENENEKMQEELNYYKFKRDLSITNDFFNDEIPPLTHFIFRPLLDAINEYPDFNYLMKELDDWLNKQENMEMTKYEMNIINNWENHIQYFLESLKYVMDDELDLNNKEHKKICKAQIDKVLESNNEDKKIKYLVLRTWLSDPENSRKEYEIVKKHQNFFNKWRKEVFEQLTPEWVDHSQDLGIHQNFNVINSIKDTCSQIFNYIANNNKYGYFQVICEYNTQKSTMFDITRALERQLHLCRDEKTDKTYISDGQGTFHEFDNKNINNIYKTIVNGCYQLPKDEYQIHKAKQIKWLNRDDIFGEIGKKRCSQQIKPEKDLIAFQDTGFIYCKNNNGYKSLEIQPFSQKYPRLPLRKIKIPLVLDREIKDTYMEKIFDECFTPNDKQLFLIYLGMCIYEPGYINHQEILYLFSKGSIGKSTLLEKTICKLIFKSDNIDPTKLNKRHRFALGVLNECDICMVDEFTNADPTSQDEIKSIASGVDKPIEQKNKNIETLPAEQVPHLLIAGNGFNKESYEKLTDVSNWRRMLPIIPLKPFTNFCSTEELQTKDNLMWLVQAATKAYWDSKMPYSKLSITELHPELLSMKTLQKRVELATFPEEKVLAQHFKISLVDGKVDDTEMLNSRMVFNFVTNECLNQMLATKIPKSMTNWRQTVEQAFDVSDINVFSRKNNASVILGLSPKTDKAKQFIEDMKESSETPEQWFKNYKGKTEYIYETL